MNGRTARIKTFFFFFFLVKPPAPKEETVYALLPRVPRVPF